jgi:hypothetical protein
MCVCVCVCVRVRVCVRVLSAFIGHYCVLDTVLGASHVTLPKTGALAF